MRGLLAAAIAATSLASGAIAPCGRGDGDLVVTLAPDGAFLQAGKPVRVKLALENRGRASVAVPNGVLFGQGLKVTLADGSERAVQETVAPAAARQPLLLPAGGSAAATIDLAPLLPDVFANAGKYTVRAAVAGVDAAPLELELARDWTGFHALLSTEFGEIELEFFPDVAPRTVANFLALVDQHFYDGLGFHRIVKGFMVQGGDPKGDGTGNSGKFVQFEKSGVKHERGVISMARQADFNSASCQFFLVHQTAPFLDGNYAAFGRIVRGLDVLDKMADVPCIVNPNGVDRGPSKPKDHVRINTLRLLPPGGADK
jgi:cyclophilin family peptidyl-prolyl cis-trans isomerase